MKLILTLLFILIKFGTHAQNYFFINNQLLECIDSVDLCKCKTNSIQGIEISFAQHKIYRHRNLERVEIQFENIASILCQSKFSDREYVYSLNCDSTLLEYTDHKGRNWSYSRVSSPIMSTHEMPYTFYLFQTLKDTKLKLVYDFLNNGNDNWYYKCACLYSNCRNVISNSDFPEEKYEVVITESEIQLFKLELDTTGEYDKLKRLDGPVLKYAY
jgi:hypothetical protein